MADAVVIGFDTATEDTAVAATRGGEPLFEASIGPGNGLKHLPIRCSG